MKRRRKTAAAAAVLTLGSLAGLLTHGAGAATVKATVVQKIDASKFDPPSSDTAGITYLPSSGRFLVTDCEIDEMSFFRGVNLWEMSPSGSVARTGVTSAYSKEPTGLSYDPRDGTLYVTDDNNYAVYMVKAGPDGKLGTSDDTSTTFGTKRLGSSDPEGIAMDTDTGELFIADGAAHQVLRLRKGPDGKFGGSDDIVARFDMGRYGLKDAEGIGYDSARHSLVVLDTQTKTLYEIDTSGNLLRTIDISAASPKGGGDVAVAPASNGHGLSYWVVLRGINNEGNPTENDGKVYEMTIGESGPSNLAPTVTITSPPDDSTYTAGTTIGFTGTADDPEDGTLTSGLRWVSSIDGEFGSGGSASAILSPGTHQITASVDDPDGAHGQASITVVVEGGPPTGGSADATLVADATLRSQTPNGNFGTAQTLEVDHSPIQDFLLKFRVSGVGSRTVTGIKLRLVNKDKSSKGGDVRPFASTSWVESGSGGVTWNSVPAPESPILASIGKVTAGTTYEITLPASAVTGDGLVSFRITSTSADGADWWSKEKGGGLAPELFVTVSD